MENRLLAFEKLSLREQKFVREFVKAGGYDEATLTNVARIVGYQGKNPSRWAAYLLRKPLVLEAVREEAARTIGAYVGRAVAVLGELMESGKDEVRLKAADRILERAGMLVERQEKITVEHTLGDAERRAIFARADEIARQRGLVPPSALLEKPVPLASTPVIDVEPVEVEPWEKL